MKKLLILVGLLTSMYAVPPCEIDIDTICVYLYKGAMSSEAILVNTTKKKMQITTVEATLDGRKKELTNLVLNPYQQITILKSKYDSPNQIPNFGRWKVNYKEIN